MRLARTSLLAGLVVAAISLSPPAARGQGRPLRFDELAKVKRVGGILLSPNGKWIAFAVSPPDVVENLSLSAIWLVAAAGGEARKLNSGDKRDSDSRFSPDGKAIAFLSNRSGGSQIHTVDLAGGEPAQATSFPTESRLPMVAGRQAWKPRSYGSRPGSSAAGRGARTTPTKNGIRSATPRSSEHPPPPSPTRRTTASPLGKGCSSSRPSKSRAFLPSS